MGHRKFGGCQGLGLARTRAVWLWRGVKIHLLWRLHKTVHTMKLHRNTHTHMHPPMSVWKTHRSRRRSTIHLTALDQCQRPGSDVHCSYVSCNWQMNVVAWERHRTALYCTIFATFSESTAIWKHKVCKRRASRSSEVFESDQKVSRNVR